MHKIKQIPEDFKVIEHPLFEFTLEKPEKDKGIRIGEENIYSYYKLDKIDCTTFYAISRVAEKLGINRERIGFAGNKDKKAVTEQYISIANTNVRSLKLDNIQIELVGYGKRPISLGDLKGNEFIITVRGIGKDELEENIKIPDKLRVLNLFDSQRFSSNNAETGKSIIKKDFKKAVELIMQGKGEHENNIRRYMSNNPSDFVGALRTVPRKILSLFINSYQAQIWNKVAEQFRSSKTNIKLPLVGFGTEFKDKKIERMVMGLLAEDSIRQRDFIIRELPKMSSEGSERDLFAYVDSIKHEIKDDELNKGKRKAILRFKLMKGSYATMVIRSIFKDVVVADQNDV